MKENKSREHQVVIQSDHCVSRYKTLITHTYVLRFKLEGTYKNRFTYTGKV